jgi:hypothetical protein
MWDGGTQARIFMDSCMFNQMEERGEGKAEAGFREWAQSSSEEASFGGIALRDREVWSATTGTPRRLAVGAALGSAGRLDSRGSTSQRSPGPRFQTWLNLNRCLSPGARIAR